MKESTVKGKGPGAPLGSRGAAMSGCFLFLLIIVVVGYAALKIGSAYWTYFETREKIRETANWAVISPARSEDEIMRRVIAQTREFDLVLTPRNIRVTQSAETITITANWVQEVEFPFYTLPLKFKVTATKGRSSR